MENFLISEIITSIVSLIALICFFVLCYNVARIRKSLTHDEKHWKREYEKHIAFGDIHEAREALKSWYWLELKKIDPNIYNAHVQIAKLNKEFGDLFDSVGTTRPEMDN
jgi:hypothetical protein